ncbi:cadherin EGF LAG seven-pass G-type receptor 2-like isoform X1 [Mercenaria mercenaria]|uniref:cadherin EGF LAG seven-pass G-type receptor 2-like isoform X1 n=1 Tax=Mercenaria mercenaria TaxID=6596 RepID=UPI00234F89DB|nr:cadherin EGF LAG seven-pass G-type receptor 2-like isoform X1 [Mercenaria mercenaria]
MLTININDVNDNKPVFTQKNPTAIIGETADIGYVVTTVAATDADISNPSNEMFYSLSGDGSDDFNIDNSGKVTVAAALNFKSKKVYSLTVTAEDSDTNPQTETTTLTINLKTGPKFTEPVDGDTLTIKETKTSNGAVVKQLTATDEDGDTALTFEVISQSPENPTMFEIEDANLLMSDAVDVDEVGAVTEYALRLKVSDGRLYTENNVITVTVDILDSNEPPTFDQSKISTILKEWEKEGDTVYTIKAKDVDITESFGQSSLKYSMTGTLHLEIDPDTGEIKVAPGVELDFSVNEKYTVIVTATDGGGLKDSIEIFFQVVTGPVFNAPMDKEEIKIAEKDTKKDAIVYVLTTSDKDNDAEMTIEIVEQAPTEPKMFHIINNNQLVITEDVDADAQNAVLSYDITLKVSDAKDDTRDSSITVTIKIEDSNDEPPIFEKEKYSTEVTDSSKPGTIVITVTATDKDITDVYSTLHYVLSQASDDADDFTVNKTSGAVAVAKGLDYDRKKSYSITLLTVDGTTDPLSDGTTIDIKIVTAPQFENLKEEMTAEVDENSAKNTIVYKLQISDKDQTAEGTSITTTIYSQTPDEGLFELDGLTLKTSRTGLDAEKQQTYTLIFRANDGKHETTSANLTVKVKDKNDEYPKFVPVEDVTIEENKATSGLESEIIVIKANDEDVTNPNNKLAYSITDGNDENLFAIDSDTGIMRLVKTPVSMTKSEHTLTIKAVDGGLPKLEASTSVKIIINDKIVEECTSTLCKNGATCMSFVNAYSCKCVLGFDGTQCENNINDCTQDSCKNDGQCIDGINSFMCDCQEGWTGSTCAEACNNNKYGRNCAKPCSCNENGLGNVGSQMCHVQNGDCFCNPHWRGKECDRDIDECEENLHNCNSAANKICNNTLGGHSCVCQQGFNENNDGSCTRRPPAEVILGVGEFPVTIVIRINIPRPCPNLRNPSVYRSEESRIIKLILGRTVAVRVIVHFISCGSLVYEATVVVNNTESAKAELANDLQNIRDDGILNLDGENVTVTNLTVENREVTPLSQSSGGMEERVCSVYTSYIQCASDEKCKYENGVASCKIVAVGK